MPATRARRRLRWLACRAIAWGICLGALLSAVGIAFRGIEAHARGALAEWRARRASPDGELLAMVRTPLPDLPLAPGTVVEQPLWASHDGFCGVRFEAGALAGAVPTSGEIIWRIVATDVPAGAKRRLATGTLDLGAARDTGWFDVRFPPLPTSAGARYVLKLLVPAEFAAPTPSLAMYTSPEGRPTPVITGPTPETPPTTFPLGTALHLRLIYAAPPEQSP